MKVMVSASPTPKAHPPRSNPFLRSSSDAPPFPCMTPSTVTCVMVISFMGPVLPRRGGRYDHTRPRISSAARLARRKAPQLQGDAGRDVRDVSAAAHFEGVARARHGSAVLRH